MCMYVDLHCICRYTNVGETAFQILIWKTMHSLKNSQIYLKRRFGFGTPFLVVERNVSGRKLSIKKEHKRNEVKIVPE